MGATVMQFVRCYSCRRCLSGRGGRGIHGPYPTFFEEADSTGKRRHRYLRGGGGKGGATGQGAPLVDADGVVWTEEVIAAARAERRAEADREYAALPSEERDLVDDVMDTLAEEKRLGRLLKDAEGSERERLEAEVEEAVRLAGAAKERLTAYRDENADDHKDSSPLTAPPNAGNPFVPATAEDRKSLAIPPAWTDVMIDPTPGAALIATGFDAKGRKQYRYSDEHHERQAAKKFEKLATLREMMPDIDAALTRDAARNDTALAALMIRRMALRPGSDADTKAEKKAHGATNLRAGHVTVTGDEIRLRFTGKKGMDLDLAFEDSHLAGLLRKRKRGKADSDRLLNTDERKVREYVDSVAPGVRPKDFRTYRATTLAANLVSTMPAPVSRKDYAKARRDVGKTVSEVLGNTVTVALASYIAPSVFFAWDARFKENQEEMTLS